MKEQYILFVLARFIRSGAFNQIVGNDWISSDRDEEIMDLVTQAAFRELGYEIPSHLYKDYTAWIFEQLRDNRGLANEGDDYTGFWFKLNIAQKNQWVDSFLESNEARRRIDRLGPEALQRALDKISREDGFDSESGDYEEDIIDRNAPAADRIVEFDHNSEPAKEIDENLDKISDLIRGDNEGVILPEGERPRIIQQFTSARDLLRVGRVSTKAIYALIGPALVYLASKFADSAIGILAQELLMALTQLLGIVFG